MLNYPFSWCNNLSAYCKNSNKQSRNYDIILGTHFSVIFPIFPYTPDNYRSHETNYAKYRPYNYTIIHTCYIFNCHVILFQVNESQTYNIYIESPVWETNRL